MATKKNTPVTAAELRVALSKLGSSAINILNDILVDKTVDNKLKVDVCKFIISQVLDDPAILNNGGDNLVKLAEILRAPAKDVK
jgi:hypothetical protein